MTVSTDEVKALRARTKWSQSQLAGEVGCNQSTIFRIENGTIVPRGAISKMLQLLIKQHPPVDADDPKRPPSHAAQVEA